MRDVSMSELVRESARIGALGFGGPAGQIALMHRVFVDERKWIGEDAFQHALAFCMLLPGPEAQQLATYVGWRLRGFWGGVVAGWLFVLPGAAIVLALSWLYVTAGHLPAVAAAFDGVKCAVVALVAEALVRIGRRSLKTRGAFVIAVVTFGALMAGAPFPVVIVCAAIFGALTPSPRGEGAGGGVKPKVGRHSGGGCELQLSASAAQSSPSASRAAQSRTPSRPNLP